MKTKIILCLSILIVFPFSLIYVQSASAHGGEPRIEIGAERLNPGAVLDIRGVDFEFEEQVVLSLVGPQVEIPFGSAIADTDGVFLQTISLPVDLSEGTYFIRGTTNDHVVDSPQITVWGSAVETTGTERLDEDAGYGLLAPMPNTLAGASTAVPATPIPLQSIAVKSSSNSWIWIAGGIGIVVLSGFVLRIKK